MLVKKESPAKSLRTRHIADEIAGGAGGETEFRTSLLLVGELKNGKKTGDPMRGPLGSLICANSAGTDSKALPLSPFYRACALNIVHAVCQSARAWQEMALPC